MNNYFKGFLVLFDMININSIDSFDQFDPISLDINSITRIDDINTHKIPFLYFSSNNACIKLYVFVQNKPTPKCMFSFHYSLMSKE